MDSSSRNAVSFSSARTTKRFPSLRIALESFLLPDGERPMQSRIHVYEVLLADMAKTDLPQPLT
jgi:hypothetical protein